jgi:hypothetical protein
VSRRPARQNSLRRSPPTRESRRLLVVCGSEGNEARYIRGLNDQLKNSAVSVKIAEKGCAPLELIEWGLGLASRSSAPYDELWCVVDVDEFIASGDNLGRAVRRAAQASSADLAITMVITNPCFELWLLLHFAEQRAHLTGYAQVKPLLLKHRPNYRKDWLDFVRDGYADRYPEAVARAKLLEPSGTAYDANPSTNWWLLVEGLGHRNGPTAPPERAGRGRR